MATFSLTVTNDDGQSATITGAFTFHDKPAITEVSPANGPISGGTTVTITGSGFRAGASVLFGDRPATNVQVNAEGTKLTCVTPDMR